MTRSLSSCLKNIEELGLYECRLNGHDVKLLSDAITQRSRPVCFTDAPNKNTKQNM